MDNLENRAKEAAKEYHDTIKRQKKAHWDDFPADDTNIWQATQDEAEQAEELLGVFFPPLPENIEDEGLRPRRREVAMPNLTVEEVEENAMEATGWMTPGEDGLPAMVWKQLWPLVTERVIQLFHTLLSEGQLPDQWRSAKIIPLKKPEKDDYSIAKAWRPVSLLSMLGKILEAVVADRISSRYTKHGRNRKVASLVSFDVKGANNGMCKDRLLQRLETRGIPKEVGEIDRCILLQPVCDDRGKRVLLGATETATGRTAARITAIACALLQRDVVQSKIDLKGGSIAFVDHYSAWVTGPTAEANREGIQAIIDRALVWGRRSGATFECDKATVIHLTRVTERTSHMPFMIKGVEVKPKQEAKILGMVMDTKLRFKEHMARAATKDLSAAMCLRRLKMLPLLTARQLFIATITPAMDYASVVWSHARDE
ncbi:hypothetical protein BFJ71_g17544 [Fusarium oxysporum]|nr:hypothetical protein BFJ71_g17544 [Fusarium oxysporum]